MSSSRPTRSCRIKPTAPVLPEVVSRINDLKGKYYENIRNEVNEVSKYFKDDNDAEAAFWLNHYEYNVLDFKHQFLIRCIFDKVGLRQPLVVEFLDKILDEDILRKLAVVRVNNGKTIFYRIRVGIDSSN
jgi:hypothetical protein